MQLSSAARAFIVRLWVGSVVQDVGHEVIITTQADASRRLRIVKAPFQAGKLYLSGSPGPRWLLVPLGLYSSGAEHSRVRTTASAAAADP